jgi:hypothetical protein
VGYRKRQIFVTFPVDGKSSADELTRRDPQLLATSAIVWRRGSPLTYRTPEVLPRSWATRLDPL